jgi:hypothetical protein
MYTHYLINSRLPLFYTLFEIISRILEEYFIRALLPFPSIPLSLVAYLASTK